MPAVIRVTCAWCHAAAWLTQTPQYCESCRHRADLPRRFCTCALCSAPAPPPTDRDVDALAADLAARLRQGERRRPITTPRPETGTHDGT